MGGHTVPKMETIFCEFSQCFSCFCVFSHLTIPHNTHHTTRISLCFLWFSVFFHTHTAHNIHTHRHTHAQHTCTPATDRDLESGLSKSHTRKNPRNMPEKGKVRGIPGEGSSRYGRASRSSAAKWRKDQSNHLVAGSLRNFCNFQEKAT